MMKTERLIFALVLGLWTAPAGVEPISNGLETGSTPGLDALDEALGQVGLRRADLGWRPKGWWPRFPADIPYKLRSFDSLFAEPLDTVVYARSLARSARVHLDPITLNDELPRGIGHLFMAVHDLGVDPKFGGLRGYSANLTAPETPLDVAILAVHRAAGRPTTFVTFGEESPYPLLATELAERVEVIPPQARPVLGRLVLNLIDAHLWAELAFRNVDMKKRMVVAGRFNLGEEQVDALDYCPEVDDVARAWDEASLWYAGEKCVQALDDARRALAALGEDASGGARPTEPGEDASGGARPTELGEPGPPTPPAGATDSTEARTSPAALSVAPPRTVPFAFDWETPWGWIRIRGGGDDVVDGTDAWLIVDLGGDDRYTGGVAASTAQRPIGVLLDMGGNDRYESGRVTSQRSRGAASGMGEDPPASVEMAPQSPAPGSPAQGAGLCGIGLLLDAAGDDIYEASRYAQGVGQFGLGACIDLGGRDRYSLGYSGQGCGYFGIGLLLDSAGDDQYILHADGQGFGGVGGVGVLADRSGDDAYTAVRDAKITGRPSYHSSEESVAVSNAQGCAMGRRGDGADGHSWAGGLGVLLDSEGHDRYTSGNWSMGTGYWFGIGLLHDGGGNDEYRGAVWSQATGAHFCIGALIDEGGDDLHIAEATSNNSLAFAHDFTVALLVNIGGNDIYDIKKNGLGYSINRSVAALIDVGGNDAYRGGEGNRPGMAIFDEKFRTRDGVTSYFADATSLALFLDVGGDDTYWSGHEDNAVWLDEPDSPNLAERNFSVGVDRPEGSVSFRPLPQKVPAGN